MDSLTITIGVIWFVLGWYGLSKVVGRLSRGLQQSQVVWCPRCKTFSLVETEPTPATEDTEPSVRHCLLWPEFHECNRSCLR